MGNIPGPTVAFRLGGGNQILPFLQAHPAVGHNCVSTSAAAALHSLMSGIFSPGAVSVPAAGFLLNLKPLATTGVAASTSTATTTTGM